MIEQNIGRAGPVSVSIHNLIKNETPQSYNAGHKMHAIRKKFTASYF